MMDEVQNSKTTKKMPKPKPPEVRQQPDMPESRRMDTNYKNIVISAEAFSNITKSLYNLSEELVRIARDMSDTRMMVVTIAHSQSAINQDMANIAKAVGLPAFQAALAMTSPPHPTAEQLKEETEPVPHMRSFRQDPAISSPRFIALQGNSGRGSG